MTHSYTNGLETATTLNIVTPCSRPYNLPLLLDSMRVQQISTRSIYVRWIIVADMPKPVSEACVLGDKPRPAFVEIIRDNFEYPSTGHAQMNLALDRHVRPGFVYRLDDDNLMHSSFWEEFARLSVFFGGIIFAQDRAKDGYVEANIRHVDSGQFVVHTDIIGESRWGLHYTADGDFLREVYHKSPGSWYLSPVIATYHNRLKTHVFKELDGGWLEL